MLTYESKVKDLYHHPVGHDIIDKLLLQMGKKKTLITNPIISNLRIKTLRDLTKKKLGEDFFDTVFALLNIEKSDMISDTNIVNRTWWKEAIFYQVYPRSFQDTNGDGIGDLKGITKQLDYLKELGVDGIWLSPIYDSPNDDNGYDIRDYRKIMNEFGTMEDFDCLLQGIHERKMHLIMDLVVNHTSDEHPWFQEALNNPDSDKRDYYFIKKQKEQPNNWTSFFSGSAWNYYESEQVWALHLFSKKQMDLNWDNPNMRMKVYAMVNWWLDKGVDGFRLDVINYISKQPGLPKGNTLIGDLMGFTGIEHYFYGPKLHDYLKELQDKAFRPHQAFSVGETPGVGIEMAKLLTADTRNELDMIFNFDHLETPGHVRFDDYRYDLNYYKQYMIQWMTEYTNHCWMSLFYENHDNPRMISKVNPNKEYHIVLAKLLSLMQLTLRGTPFIYQGQENGAANVEFASIEELHDIESLNLYQELVPKMGKEKAFQRILAGTRDHARVMMQFPQQNEIRDFYHDLIQLRKQTDAFTYGEIRFSNVNKKNLFVYERVSREKKETYCIECNLCDKVIPKKRINPSYVCILSNYTSKNSKQLQPYEGNLYKMTHLE